MPKIVVLGGGYAGLACLIELSRRDKQAQLHLIDAEADHCKQTNLHKTFRYPAEKYCVPYTTLAERFSFTFHQQRVAFTLEDLARWQQEGALSLAGEKIPFDALVISSGAAPRQLPDGAATTTANDLRKGGGPALIDQLRQLGGSAPLEISCVGGGATGIQFLWELEEELARQRIPHNLRLIDLNRRLVPGLPRTFHAHIRRKLQRKNISYLAETGYLGQQQDVIELQQVGSDASFALPSHWTLLFPGVTPAPQSFAANAYGQVLVDGAPLASIFVAGDCSRFDSSGLNQLTAQAAVRKGKLVARNILRLGQGRSMLRYTYQEKGYILSLGGSDAIGWVGLRLALVKGLPAALLKEAMETQYDLFLNGVDTYFDFF